MQHDHIFSHATNHVINCRVAYGVTVAVATFPLNHCKPFCMEKNIDSCEMNLFIFLFLIVIPRYKKRLESDGLTIKSFRCSNFILKTTLMTTRDFFYYYLRLRGLGINVPGAFRKLVAFPADLTWNYVKNAHACSGESADCHSEAAEGSGLSVNESKRLKLGADSCSGDEEEHSFRFTSKIKELSTVEQRNNDNNCSNDVELCFSLRPSCYATSCIRELLKN